MVSFKKKKKTSQISPLVPRKNRTFSYLFITMESDSLNCKRLKRDEDDGVRADSEGNVTVCLVVPPIGKADPR